MISTNLCKNHIRWSDEEVRFLKENYAKMKAREIAERLGRTKLSVVSKASELGLRKREWRRWGLDEVEFLMNNYGRMKVREIAERLGRSEHSVRVKLSKLGLKRSSLDERCEMVLKILEGFGGVYIGSLGNFIKICRACGVLNAVEVVRVLRGLGLINCSRLISRQRSGLGTYKVFGDIGNKTVIWTNTEELVRILNEKLNYCSSPKMWKKILTQSIKNVFGSEVVERLKNLCTTTVGSRGSPTTSSEGY